MTGEGFCTTHKNGDGFGILHGIGFTYHIHAVILDLGYLGSKFELRIVAAPVPQSFLRQDRLES